MKLSYEEDNQEEEDLTKYYYDREYLERVLFEDFYDN